MALSLLPFAFPGLQAGPCTVRCYFQMRSPAPFQEKDYAGGNISFDVGDDADSVAHKRQALAEELARACGPQAKASAAAFPGICELRQVHGCNMVFDPTPQPFTRPSALPEADGMATDQPGLALLIKTADCQPLLLAHESGACIAALHVGWRGNRMDFPGLAVRAICERYKLRPHDFFAVRGPSLGPAAAEFVNFAAEWGPDFEAWHDAQAQTMDLWRLTRAQLVAAGLRGERIFGLDLCTHSLPDAFFSYRRRRICGRQAGIIVLGTGANAC